MAMLLNFLHTFIFRSMDQSILLTKFQLAHSRVKAFRDLVLQWQLFGRCNKSFLANPLQDDVR